MDVILTHFGGSLLSAVATTGVFVIINYTFGLYSIGGSSFVDYLMHVSAMLFY